MAKLSRVIELNEYAIGAPVLHAFGERLVVAWTGTDHRINLRFSADGVNFRDWDKIILPETSTDGPALSVEGRTLALGWVGTNRQMNFAWLIDDQIVDKQRFDIGRTGPALIRTGTAFCYAYVKPGDTNNPSTIRVWTTPSSGPIFSFDRVNRTSITLVDLPYESDTAPRLSADPGSTVHLLWRGVDVGHSLNIVTSLDSGASFADKLVISNSGTVCAPDLIQTNTLERTKPPVYYLAWPDDIATNGAIGVMSVRTALDLTGFLSDATNVLTTYFSCISAGPRWSAFVDPDNKSMLLMAFTDADGKIYIGHV
jgi:hypothetical protein